MDNDANEDLPGCLYQPVKSNNAPVLVTGIMARARRIAKEKGITIPEALVSFEPAKSLTPGEWTEVDGRRVFMPKVQP